MKAAAFFICRGGPADRLLGSTGGCLVSPGNFKCFSEARERVIGAPEEEIVFPYAFMNTDRDLITTEMFCSKDEKKLQK